MTADVVVAGCGLSGMVAARELADAGYTVSIIEKRMHIGGNTYDYYDEDGILVQKYGPHVFFTDHADIKEYVQRFTGIRYFYPECRTLIGDKFIPMPFNFQSADMIYPAGDAEKLKRLLEEEFGKDSIVSVLQVIESAVKEIHDYGMYMYEHEYRKYSAKQWGRPIGEIDPGVFMRVPVYISYKKEYLRPEYQFMPDGGFTKLAEKLVNHPNISVSIGTDALDHIYLDTKRRRAEYRSAECGQFDGPVVFTGPLDALFQYRLGELPYRALEFSWKKVKRSETIETPLCAFPEGDKYIRITDYAQFPPQGEGDGGTVCIEFPVEYKRNELCGNEPFYPVLTEESRALSEKYKKLAGEYDNLFYCGRLAEFKYYNMDEVIKKAQDVSEKIKHFLKMRKECKSGFVNGLTDR